MGRVDGYLDIETTGFSPQTAELTVIGLYVVYGRNQSAFYQPYGSQISARSLRKALSGIDTLYTYNGTRFDLPFIEEKTGVAIEKSCRHEDLMYRCWEKGLYGGLKGVERLLEIPRITQDIDGWMAVQLWRRFCRKGDQTALQRLLAYNREDVMNLTALRRKLHPK
ncbi:MAG: ribonuclease H-like domain-containing protein [Candidatus Omnitrophota bacterium]